MQRARFETLPSVISAVYRTERRGSVVVSTPAWHAAGRGLIPEPGML